MARGSYYQGVLSLWRIADLENAWEDAGLTTADHPIIKEIREACDWQTDHPTVGMVNRYIEALEARVIGTARSHPGR